MIKRLFRTWLRVQLHKKISFYTNFEECFQWVYTKPIFEWGLRIYCLQSSRIDYYEKVGKREELLYKADLTKASSIWEFLHK